MSKHNRCETCHYCLTTEIPEAILRILARDPKEDVDSLKYKCHALPQIQRLGIPVKPDMCCALYRAKDSQ